MNELPILLPLNVKLPPKDDTSKVTINFVRPESESELAKKKITDYLLMTGLLFFLNGVESEIKITVRNETYLVKANEDTYSVSITKCDEE